MKRYAMKLSYDGSKFYGWQVQVQSPTVQECLEKGLSIIAKKPVKVIGSGRTDSGVHALGQVCHFDFPFDIPTDRLSIALKSYLPHSIKVLNINEVSDNFHSRYDAIWRKYRYIITFDRTPFNCCYKASFHRYKINIDTFRSCIPYFLGEHDFTSFSKPNPDITNYIANIYEIIINQDDDLVIEIKGSRFFHNMVRRIVGAMVAVSHNHLDVRVINDWLNLKRHDQRNYITAPAAGLYLVEVGYK